MHLIPGSIAQSVESLTADPDVASLIRARFQTFMEMDHETIRMAILLLQEGLLSVTSESICKKYWLVTKSCLPRK